MTDNYDYVLKLVYKEADKRITEYLYFTTLDSAKEFRKRRFERGDCVIGIVGTREEIARMESHFTRA
jgi:hypothetical protein